MSSETEVDYRYLGGVNLIATAQFRPGELLKHGKNASTVASTSDDYFTSGKYRVEIVVDGLFFSPRTEAPIETQ
jgi:hypothetical protein